jgi:hypothetical protein
VLFHTRGGGLEQLGDPASVFSFLQMRYRGA